MVREEFCGQERWWEEEGLREPESPVWGGASGRPISKEGCVHGEVQWGGHQGKGESLTTMSPDP